jgi:hypothetical protein
MTELVDPQQAARLLGVSPRTLDRWHLLRIVRHGLLSATTEPPTGSARWMHGCGAANLSERQANEHVMHDRWVCRRRGDQLSN